MLTLTDKLKFPAPPRGRVRNSKKNKLYGVHTSWHLLLHMRVDVNVGEYGEAADVISV